MNNIINTIKFPKFTGIKCNMMPFIQGDSSSLPDKYKPYHKIINDNYLEKGEIGFLTIDESFVSVGESQRGYNSTNANRSVHIEVGRVEKTNYWGSGTDNGWGGRYNTLLDDDTMVLIANSISNTCRLWDKKEMSYTKNGDLGNYIYNYPTHQMH